MIKENFYQNENNFKKTSEFAENRKLPGGGKYIIIKHNPKFIDGINNYFYSIYCHLDHNENHSVRGHFIKAGDVIGKMGNTGNCWTKSITGWRPVTKQEKLNKNCNKGVHLHQGFYQVCDPGKITILLKILQIAGLCKINKPENQKDYFWQWGKLYFRPKCIMDYFKILQEKKKHGNN